MSLDTITMNDQATTLRLMAAAPYTSPGVRANVGTRDGSVSYAAPVAEDEPRRSRTIAVASGKGGVGKSNVVVNVALELAALNRRVSLLDADLALANADVLVGVNPQFNLGHVLEGERSLKDVVLEINRGVRLIPGGSGVEELANLSSDAHRRLVAELRAMEHASDFMLIDTPAGVAANVMGVLRAANEVVIVTTPDPTALVDAYATIKVLHSYSPTKPIWVVVNDVVGIGDAENIFNQLRKAAASFLKHDVEHLGSIPRDPELAVAVREQKPVVEYAPNAPASRALRLIAKHLDQHTNARPSAAATSVRSFWTSLAELPV